MVNIVLKQTTHTKEELKQKGIYKIYHINRPQKVYVGSTFCIKGFMGRWYGHLNNLIQNKHSSPTLQSLFNKYGLSGLTFEIIEITDNKEDNVIKEKHYIDIYDKTHTLLNIYKEVFSKTGYVYSKEQKEAMSTKLSGKRMYDNRKKIYQYSQEGALIKEWESSQELSRAYGKQRCYFYFKSKIKGFKDFVLSKYLLDETELTKIKNKEYVPYRTQKREVNQYDLNGNFIKEWDCGRDVEKHFNLGKGNISQALNGSVKTLMGFVWKFKN